MRIPTSNLQLTAPYGQTQAADHQQFGHVELSSDARIDDSFKARPGYGDAAQWHDLSEPALAKLIGAEARLASSSLEAAQEAFHQGAKPDEYKLGEQHYGQMGQAVKESGLYGMAFPHTDWRGVLTDCSIHLHDSSHGFMQELKLTTGDQGTTAQLISSRRDGKHEISVPVNPDGSFDLARSTEKLELQVPFLDPSATSFVGANGIKTVTDPRLERIAEAADRGYFLSGDELGAGWTSKNNGTTQEWTISNQKLSIDTKDHSFRLTAHGWGTGHAGSGDDVGTDYDIDSALRWKDGRFERVEP